MGAQSLVALRQILRRFLVEVAESGRQAVTAMLTRGASERPQGILQAFGQGDIGTILANVTDDVDCGTETTAANEVPWYRIRTGREGVGDFFATLAREVDFPKFEPTLFAAVEDQVLVRVDYQYRFKKNGKGTDTAAVHQFTVRDGRVSKFRAYEDTASVLEQWRLG